jgi:transposase
MSTWLFRIFRFARLHDMVARSDECCTTRAAQSKALILDLENWLRAQRKRLSPRSETAQAIDYLLRCWALFSRFLKHGRICLSNNAAERALRGIAIACKNWTLAGSDFGSH